MNYNIVFCGTDTISFEKVIKLFMETANDADYLVSCFPHEKLSPHGAVSVTVELIGSSKNEAVNLCVDFDGIYTGNNVVISADDLGIVYTGTSIHYWGLIASLFQVMGDLSPSFFISYLLEHGSDREMSLFKQYLAASLPLSIQDSIAAKPQ